MADATSTVEGMDDEALLATYTDEVIAALVDDVLADTGEPDPYEVALALLQCRVCGKRLDAIRATRRTCSDRCRQRLSRARRA